MGFPFWASGTVKEKIRLRLIKDGNGIFSSDELERASDAFAKAGDSKDIDALRDDNTQKDKAIEIFKRIKPSSVSESELIAKVNSLYNIA